MKIKFNFDDDLLLNKPLKFHLMTIIIRSVSEEGGKFYPQLFQRTLCMSQCKNAAIQVYFVSISRSEGLRRLNSSVLEDKGVL